VDGSANRRLRRARLPDDLPPATRRPRRHPPSDRGSLIPTAFVETAAEALVDLGHDSARVKTERFGPTG
jgi:hypothetical protein